MLGNKKETKTHSLPIASAFPVTYQTLIRTKYLIYFALHSSIANKIKCKTPAHQKLQPNAMASARIPTHGRRTDRRPNRTNITWNTFSICRSIEKIFTNLNLIFSRSQLNWINLIETEVANMKNMQMKQAQRPVDYIWLFRF